MEEKIKIAVADDHPLVITGLDFIISNCSDMVLTGSYSDGKNLLRGLETTVPNVLLLDIHMPGQSGDDLADIIHGTYPAVKILVLTNEDNVYYIKNMLRKGVDGYILKTSTESILLNAIRTVSRGEKYLEPALKEKVVDDTMQATKQLASQPMFSRREKEVLEYIASDLTSQQIADKLCVSKRTIDYHRLNLLTKLGVKNTAALVKKVIQLGLIE